MKIILNKSIINTKKIVNLLLIILSILVLLLFFFIFSPNYSLSHKHNNNSYILLRSGIIYQNIIKNYINKLNRNDIKQFISKNNIRYTEEEIDTIYSFIINNYNDLTNGNTNIFNNLKNKISSELYQNLLNLYLEYKNKYL